MCNKKARFKVLIWLQTKSNFSKWSEFCFFSLCEDKYCRLTFNGRWKYAFVLYTLWLNDIYLSFSCLQQGKEAIRVEVLESLKDEKPNFADQKSREFWIRKKHLCFIMDVPVTFQEFSQELQLRSSSSQVMMTRGLVYYMLHAKSLFIVYRPVMQSITLHSFVYNKYYISQYVSILILSFWYLF